MQKKRSIWAFEVKKASLGHILPNDQNGDSKSAWNIFPPFSLTAMIQKKVINGSTDFEVVTNGRTK